MKRAKKIVLVCNCLLNVNCKITGLAEEAGASELIVKLIKAGYGIIQLPCVEMAMFGSQRWGVVYEQCDFPEYRNRCRDMLAPIIAQIKDFEKNGYSINGIIGADGSPTCGINTIPRGTWGGEFNGANNYEIKLNTLQYSNGMGVMMEELQFLLKDNGLDIPLYAIDESDISSEEGVIELL